MVCFAEGGKAAFLIKTVVVNAQQTFLEMLWQASTYWKQNATAPVQVKHDRDVHRSEK